MSRTLAIPETGTVIGEESRDIPFTATLKYGQRLKLDGLVGSRVEILAKPE
ncbi:hypothetical protein [Chitinimonas arctica]|uniref:hypothetical protein n=1 Tax=Chitinimonas arctica TaxID=2594795 RepID=UPI0015D33322|nr:hypothetical protein [Chitinimonas arctica]